MRQPEASNRRGGSPARSQAGPTTPDPVEIAMEAANDPTLTGPVRTLLENQGRLVLWQIASERAGLALKLLSGLAGAAVGALLILMAWRAHGDHSIVLAGFELPPALVAEGLSGNVLATDLLDKLIQIQRDTATSQQGTLVRAAEGQEIKLEVPTTGISLGEVQRAFNGLLGRQIPLSGTVDRVHGGAQNGALTMTVRLGSDPGRRLVQPDGDLDALLSRGAEQVAESAEPLRFMLWLDQHGRTPEAIDLASRLSRGGPLDDRAGALQFLASRSDSLDEAKRLLLAAIDLDPRSAGALGDLAARMPVSEAQLDLLRKAVRSVRSGDSAARLSRLVQTNSIHVILGHYVESLASHCARYSLENCTSRTLADRAMATAAETEAQDASAPIRAPNQAIRIALSHDLASARRYLAAQPLPDPSHPPAAEARVQLLWLQARYTVATLSGDWAGALSAAQAWTQLATLHPNSPATFALVTTAVPLAQRGRLAEAQAAADALPDCYLCLIAKAQVAEVTGDRPAADRLFQRAVSDGPSLPRADWAWAEVLLARGDADGAIQEVKAANRKAPHFADPLEVWGEALLAKGEARGAARKFANASKYAPYWGRLHLKWAQALAKSGNTADARAHRATAGSLDLTSAERAELNGWKL